MGELLTVRCGLNYGSGGDLGDRVRPLGRLPRHGQQGREAHDLLAQRQPRVQRASLCVCGWLYCPQGHLCIIICVQDTAIFGASARPTQYTQYTEFQSHNAEFDYLKSLEIEEKINQIKWARASNNAQYLLSTNDKTIKLWKVCERNVREVTQYNAQAAAAAASGGGNGRAKVICPSGIRLPQCSVRNRVTASTAKRVFANAHTYHINSIALNSDGETFMSADDLRVNLWSLCRTDQSFSTSAWLPSVSLA